MSRKRSNGKVEVKIPTQLPPLMQNEVQYFNELVEASNQYSGLLKQKAQYEYIVGQLQENRKKIQKDEVKLPINVTLIPKLMTYTESDKKKVLKMFDEQLKAYQQNLSALASQLTFAYENFTESGIRNKEFLTRRFEKVNVGKIVPDRKIIKDEEILFESEFTDMIKDPKIAKEFKEAKKEAIKKNAEK